MIHRIFLENQTQRFKIALDGYDHCGNPEKRRFSRKNTKLCGRCKYLFHGRSGSARILIESAPQCQRIVKIGVSSSTDLPRGVVDVDEILNRTAVAKELPTDDVVCRALSGKGIDTNTKFAEAR
jgi:hypothetical protein